MTFQYPTPAEAKLIAGEVFASRYNDAAFAFAAGSIMRGEGTFLSDIDLVVIYDRIEAARRESFYCRNIPIEAFVQDLETIGWFIENDIQRGRPSLLNMIVEGHILGQEGNARKMQSWVAGLLAAGPRDFSQDQLDSLRYQITDAIDDLRGQRSQQEIMAIGASLLPLLVELSLRGRRQWNGTGKWAPRLLRRADPILAEACDRAFRKLFQTGVVEEVISVAEAALAPHGGVLFDGYCQTAPASRRTTPLFGLDEDLPESGSG